MINQREVFLHIHDTFYGAEPHQRWNRLIIFVSIDLYFVQIREK